MSENDKMKTPAEAGARQQIEELYQMKSKFLANISHEFRTPLTLILGPTEILLSRTKDPDDKVQLERIQRNSQKLLKLINQLLDLSRIEAGQLALRFSLHDIGAFCLHLGSAFESLATHRGIDLRINAKPEEHYLYFDPEKLEHVINNLLNNALKFMDKGSVTLDIESNNKTIEISVTDTGIGIHPEKQPYVFDRFYQASEHAGIEYEGTGIGLALCKELVELHHGEISVHSEVGKGSTFKVTLPHGREHLSDDQIVPISSYSPGKLVAFGTPMTASAQVTEDTELPDALIVDDNHDMLDFVSEQLEPFYDILKANNGEQALEIAFERVPDVVISDVMMPGMNGFELCAKLKSDIRTDHIPVILLTARVGSEHRIEGLKASADDYIQKPFSTEELRIRIANLIDNRRILRKKYAEYLMFDPAEVADSPQEADFLRSLNDIVEEKLSDADLDVGALSEALGMSRSQLNRKLKSVTGRSPNDYIRTYRLERGRLLLQKGDLTVSEVAYDVGFSSPAYFSKCFKDAFGTAPSEV